jgi:hypothetical protein
MMMKDTVIDNGTKAHEGARSQKNLLVLSSKSLLLIIFLARAKL